MSEEEKKAIDIVKNITEDDLLNYWEGPEEPYNAIQTVLNLIEKQQEQLQEKDKVIDLMAEQIDLFKNKMDMLRNFEEDCFIPREFSDIDDCVKRKECKECIIEYFTKKAREV